MEYLSPRDGGLPYKVHSALGATQPKFNISPQRLRSEIKLIAIFFGVTLALVLFCSSRANASPVPVVRVMVDREKSALRINGFDLVARAAETVEAPETTDTKARAPAAHDRAAQDRANDERAVVANGRGTVNVKCSLGGKLTVEASGKKMQLSGPVSVSSLGGFIRVGTKQYRDDLYVYSFNGDCIVVNHVDIEKYVAGLLNSEMSASWNLNALKAQAVAARTYALHQMREAGSTRFRGLKAPFDVEGSVRDQVYEGAHQEKYKSLKAVQSTRGLVLTYNGDPIKAFYHSTCGGKTESPEQVWGSRLPYLKPVVCGNCTHSPRFNWVYDITKQEMEKKLRNERLLKGSLVSMRVVERNKVGRASRVEIVGSQGNLLVGATRIRDLMGTLNVRSTQFEMAASGNKFTFIGHGSGHGVGMCQYGAKAMGDRGNSYQEILKRYYPVAQLTKFY